MSDARAVTRASILKARVLPARTSAQRGAHLRLWPRSAERKGRKNGM